MELQSKSCLPVYSLTRDLNEDPNNSWSSYYVEKKVNDHLYDSHMQRPANGYLGYDKEIIKRAMLEHEEIFREQVYELHRLYITQKDMMFEFQTRALHKSAVPEETSQSNSFSSPMRSENCHMIWQSSKFPVVKNCHDNMPFVVAHDMRPPTSFMKEDSVQSGLGPTKNSSSFKENEYVEYKVESQSRRMIDLHLPAEVYIDLNDEGTSEKDTIRSSAHIAEVTFCTGNPQSTTKLTVGNAEGNSSRKDEFLLGSSMRNGIITEKLSTLNKLTTCVTGSEELASIQFLGMKPHNENNLDHFFTKKSNENDENGLVSTLSVPDFRNLNGVTNNLFPNFRNDDYGRRGKGPDLFSESLYRERFSVPSAPSLKQKPMNGNETSAKCSHDKMSSNSGSGFPLMPASFPVPQKSFTTTSSSFVSSGTMSLNGRSNLQISPRELPCLNSSPNVSTKSVVTNAAPQSAVAIFNIHQNNDNLPSGERRNAEDPCCNTGSYRNFDLNSNDGQPLFLSKKLKCMDSGSSSNNGNEGHQMNGCVKDFQCRTPAARREINLNQAPCAVDNDIREQDGLLVEKKTKGQSGPPSWLRETGCSKLYVDLNSLASDVESNISDDCHELPSTKFSTPKTSKEVNEMDFSMHGPNVSSQAIDKKMPLNKAFECNDKRPCGFLVPEKTGKTSLELPFVPQVEGPLANNLKSNKDDGFLFAKLNFDQKIACSDTSSAERCKEKVGTDYKSLIDLSVELPTCDEEALPNSKIEFSASDCCRTSDAKASSKVGLELPIYQDDSSIVTYHESMELSERNSSCEKEGSFENLARLAAENIVAISMNQISHLDEVDHHDGLPCDSLNLFVEVALSISEGTKTLSRHKGDHQLHDDNGLDLFEAMTLALEEVKVHDLCNEPNGPEKKEETDEENIGAGSHLFTRRRRGQGRRRRQRKDFQKDILPGLASLSRHEVVEDLQLIGDLMKASGVSWQSGLGRRNSGRNAANSRAKGKRQLASCSAAAVETHANSDMQVQLPIQPGSDEPEIIASSMIGWGRTTRRCRRQKTLPCNVVSSLA